MPPVAICSAFGVLLGVLFCSGDHVGPVVQAIGKGFQLFGVQVVQRGHDRSLYVSVVVASEVPAPFDHKGDAPVPFLERVSGVLVVVNVYPVSSGFNGIDCFCWHGLGLFVVIV